MRERLAIARARGSNMEVIASAAFGDMLGNLLLRGIDNGDSTALHRAKWILSQHLARRSRFELPRAAGVVVQVLVFLHDQRCPVCEGRQFIRQDTSVKACAGCNGRGLLALVPDAWGANQRRILYEAQAAMGRALSSARLAADPA